MRRTGINLGSVKVRNRSSILRTINNQGAMPRKDIAAAVGLTPAAVTLLCTEMLEEGLLVEMGEVHEEGKVGRKKILVDICYSHKYVIAISIELKTTYIHICDLKGDVLKKKNIPTDPDAEPETFLSKIAEESEMLLLESNISKEKVMGIGVGIPGIVDRLEGVSLRAYGIWKREVQVRKRMERYFDCPVIVENNIKAFAEGELLYGRGRIGNNLLFVKWGPGVGSSIVIQNQIYEGKEYGAAEIGHYIIEAGGELCKCGRKGCLETRVSISAMTQEIRSLYSKEETPQLYKITKGEASRITEEVFTGWIEQSDTLPEHLTDEKIVGVLQKNIERLARVIVNVMTVLAPDYTILFGSMLENQYIEKEFLKYCRSYDEKYTNEFIVKSKLSKKIYWIGPTAVVTRELLFEQ